MQRIHSQRRSLALLFVLASCVLAITGCQQVDSGAHGSGPTSSASSGDGKIAITTSSEDARKEYLAGRDLQEKLRITDSIQHFDKAISMDPGFAMAELNRANTSP